MPGKHVRPVASAEVTGRTGGAPPPSPRCGAWWTGPHPLGRAVHVCQDSGTRAVSPRLGKIALSTNRVRYAASA